MHPHTYPFLFENGDFYLQFGLDHPHVSSENSHRKHIFSKTLSRVGFLKNAGFSFTCGQTKMEVFKYVDVIHHILLAWRMLRKGCSRISIVSAFSVVWTGENDLNMLRMCGCIFFEKGGYPDACGWGHNRCIDHCKIFQDLVSQDTTLFPQYKFTLFAITHTSIPFSKPAVNPRMYFLIHGVK